MNISLFNEHCCGCGECINVCPQNAIQMHKNYQGFFYPEVDNKKCIDCSLCYESCSFNIFNGVENDGQLVFAAKNKNEVEREKSRSGGIFSILSNEVLQQGGVVYGCRLNNSIEAEHYRAKNLDELEPMHGSKYIQSNIVDCFNNVKNDLENGFIVLFSGTACQVNAIKDYCKDIATDNLILVDIVCHGVPSQRVWNDYCTYIEEKTKNKIKSVNFRNKKDFGWAAHKETFYFTNGTSVSTETYKDLFYGHLILRDSCFDCPFKSVERVGDITLADCWGIAQNEPGFDDDKGVSLVLVNSKKGRLLFEKVKSNLTFIKVNANDYLQPPLCKNWKKPDNYEAFWKYYQTHTFQQVIDKFVYPKPSFTSKVKRKIKSLLTFRNK